MDLQTVKLKPGQVLQVRRWKDVFEKSDAKKLKVLTWVSHPTDFASNGIQLLFDDFPPAEAVQLYGVWCCLVKIAARTPERGRLGGSQGKAYSTAALSRLMMGVPCELIDTLISWCVQRSGWLEVVEVGVAHESPPTPLLPASENLGESPDYRTGPDRTRQDISGRPERPPPGKEVLEPLAQRVLAATRMRHLGEAGRDAVFRFAWWLEQFDDQDRRRDEILALLRSERPERPWRFLFATCRSRDPQPETFGSWWDSVRYATRD